jgi:3-dehydroquinate synthase
MNSKEPEIFIGSDTLSTIPEFAFSESYSQRFVLVDENTHKHCYPLVKSFLPPHHIIEITSGEENKTLAACETIWKKLTDENADRKTLLINLGGGVIGDIGGFAAGCYKRGIKFINVPTTLLAMVDASVGGKTGIDFLHYKNQIGLFNDPEAIFIHTGFLKTLPERELRAGLAEVIKHYAIADAEALETLFNLLLADGRKEFDLRQTDWNELVQKNIDIKSSIVARDKYEAGDRKALNFGHTIGHALETYWLNKGKNVLHGEAVAAGMLCEWRLSENAGTILFQTILLLSPGNLHELRKEEIPEVMRLIKQDKKNSLGQNQFTLLEGIGNFSVNNIVEESKIKKALEYYSEFTEIQDEDSTSN